MKGHLFLIGFMGVGKSAVSGRLAGDLMLPCMDMDAEIERRAGKRITEIFETEGEAAFREMETALLKELAKEPPMVISCGGGITLSRENRELMKSSGTVCLLTAEPETVLERIGHDNTRPLLNGNRNLSCIGKLMEERKSRYAGIADLTVATDKKTVEEVAKEIQRSLADSCHSSGES